MVPDFRQLIDASQVYLHSKCCVLPNGKSRFGRLQKIAQHTRIRGYSYHFARDAEKLNIAPHNPSLLAYRVSRNLAAPVISPRAIFMLIHICHTISDGYISKNMTSNFLKNNYRIRYMGTNRLSL
jgi:hypothetical protein